MQLPKGSGLEVLDRLTRKSLNYYSGLIKSNRLPAIKISAVKLPPVKLPQIRLPSAEYLSRPVESLIKGLNSVVSQFTENPEKVDYTAVVNSFLPPGARLLKPQYPENSNEIQFADLDSDGRNELVTSYKTADGIRTLVLKKDEVQWYKMAEISNPDFSEIHYRNSADVAGDGKNYLLLGLTSRLNSRVLFAYALTDGSARKIFSREYSKLEVQKSRSASGSITDAIAFWDEEASGIYNIDLVHWNGIDLERLSPSRYLVNKVVPYHIKNLRQNPDDTISWYNLANSLSGSGDTVRAARAVDLGLRHNPDAMLRSKFDALKARL